MRARLDNIHLLGTSLLMLLLLAGLASAESYYADVTITVDEAGTATISGRTNHPALQEQKSEEYTSKKGSYWVFNLSLPEQDVFSDMVFAVNLPEGASANYVKAGGGFRIETEDNRIAVKGADQNAQFRLVIQYQTGKGTSQRHWVYIIVLPVFLFFAGFMVYFSILKMKEPKHPVAPAKLKQSSLEDRIYNSSVLNERQKNIIKIIINSRKPVTQTRICDELSLPKSSVSRNIDSLVSKGLVKKEKRGMSTVISLGDLETIEKKERLSQP